MGVVKEITGTVFIRSSGVEQKKLDSKRDRGRALYSGERVRCEKGAVLRLWLGGQTKVINGPSPWYTIQAEETASNRHKTVLNEYVRMGGRRRNLFSPIFSPANNSMASPTLFVIRWNPMAQIKKVVLIIKEEKDGKVLWQEPVDPLAGSLASESARDALSRYRAEKGEGLLFLVWRDGDTDEYKAAFKLLSVHDEQNMNKELAQWDSETDSLIRSLGRAAVYYTNGMLSQAADEYEAALGANPESYDLLLRTILALRETGNSVREEELKKRLTSGTKP
jgi:hypothetical protein